MRRNLTLALAVAVAACAPPRQAATPAASGASPAEPALKDVFRNDFMVGAALNPAQFGEQDAVGVALIRRHFNTITPENVLKWENVHPRPGEYDFGPSDRYVEFGVRNGMFVVGHTLVWHSQVPRWVFQDAGNPVSRDTLLGRMRDHIHAVVGRYKGRIKGWDVVNEALEEDGTLRRSPWRNIIGDDYIVKAFQFAHEADPDAELYYNDYSLENPAKRDGAVALVRRLQAAGVRVAAIGTQEHNKLDWPSVALVDSMLSAFAATGVRVAVTELDVDVLPRPTRNTGADVSMRAEARAELNPYAAALPDSVQRAHAARYGELFRVYLRHRDVIDRITFWGVRDGDSWLNDWPVRGRTNHPLVFDRAGRPKPAFDAVVREGQQAPPPSAPREVIRPA
ncbi:MAG TPA: endo-1,4-beta-xylanase [Gemmatimonadaceae bacterium]|nr:endo-1,4-beta-xylanase [Gemmatimonadaceae bacterium]